MKHDYIILTENLKMRQVQPEDIFHIMEWRNNEETRKWFLNSKIITREEQALWYQEYLEKDNDIMFAIEEKSNAYVIIGTIALSDIDLDNHIAEAGRFMIGSPDAHGKGIGFESMAAVCEFGFKSIKLKKIYCRVYEDNKSCSKILSKVGFKIMSKEHIESNRDILIFEYLG